MSVYNTFGEPERIDKRLEKVTRFTVETDAKVKEYGTRIDAAEESLEKLDRRVTEVAGSAGAVYVNITVQCQSRNGTAPTGQTVSLYSGTSLVESKEYDGQPVVFTVASDFAYRVSAGRSDQGHYPTAAVAGTARTDTTVILTCFDSDTIESFEELKIAVASHSDAGTAADDLVGLTIDDYWTDDDGATRYNNPMVCVDVRNVEDAGGVSHLAAIMQRKYATKYDFQFDRGELTEVATETVAQEGVNYYAQVSQWDSGKTYGPGEYVVTEGAGGCGCGCGSSGWYGSGILYKCVAENTNEAPGNSDKWVEVGMAASYSGGLTPLYLTPGTIIPYDQFAAVYRDAVLDSSASIQYGYNNWKHSAFRQYLNSDKTQGEWWEPQHVGDIAPRDSDLQHRGYMAGCSKELLAAAKPVKVKTWANVVTDAGKEYETLDTFFLPSGSEMYAEVNERDGAPVEGGYWKYFKDATGWDSPSYDYTQYRQFRRESAPTGSPVDAWLRSARRDYSYYAWLVYSDGTVYYYGIAYTASAGVPACAIY